MYNLEVEHLEKNYDDFKLDDINIKLPKGKIIGLIGENGSGKTTTIKAILNLINIDKGSIKIFNKDYKDVSHEDIGVVLDDSFFSNVLKIDDINILMKHFYKRWDEILFYKYVEEYKLPRDVSIKKFSSGMKMKLKVICALCHKAHLLILDEATNGLDPVFRYEILDLFSKFVENKDNSIFISSHITSDLEHIADYIIFIDNGKIILDIKKKELFKRFGIVDVDIEDFKNIDNSYYLKYLKYKDIYKLLIDDKDKFLEKYSNYKIKEINIEELMLMFLKGESEHGKD